MKRIAIVGVGPTGIYTFYELVKRGEPLAITLFEKEAQAGWVCPTVTIIPRRRCWPILPALRSPHRPDLPAMAAAAKR